jgi:hypothetical protein
MTWLPDIRPTGFFTVSQHISAGRVLSHAYDAVTPEKLCMADFLNLLMKAYEHGELNRLVVDEVCQCFLEQVNYFTRRAIS